MPKRFALQPLVELTRNLTDAAARSLGSSNSLQHNEESKLRMLLSYRRDYQEKFEQAAKDGMDLHGWRNFHGFMCKLEEAIGQQQQVVAHCQETAAACRHQWNTQQRKLKSYDTLAQRHRKAELQQEAASERREHDNRAATAHARARKNQPG